MMTGTQNTIVYRTVVRIVQHAMTIFMSIAQYIQ
jgi:hypothetical protein